MSRLRQALNLLLGRDIVDLGALRPGQRIRIERGVYRVTSISRGVSLHEPGQVEISLLSEMAYLKAHQTDWGQT